MPDYRLYFVNAAGAIEAREGFSAPGDDAALVVAEVVCRACSDTCHSYELWRGDKQVLAYDASRADNVVAPTDQQAIRIQQITLNLEETLQRDHWRIARSQKLIAETERLKEKLKAFR